MPPREWRIRVTDMIEAAERALRYTNGISYEEFSSDARTVDAVSYAIVIIGEAVRHVPEPIQLSAQDVPWVAIRGMRNRVAHEYFGIDVRVLWETVCEDLPQLLPPLRALAARKDAP